MRLTISRRCRGRRADGVPTHSDVSLTSIKFPWYMCRSGRGALSSVLHSAWLWGGDSGRVAKTGHGVLDRLLAMRLPSQSW